MQPSPSEEFAYALVRRVLGDVVVEHRDTGSACRQGEVDAHLHFSNGHTAALEVTTLVGQEDAETEAALAQDDFTWPSPELRWLWMCSVGPSAKLREVKAKLPVLLAFCEANDVKNPALLYRTQHPLVEWLREAGVSASAAPDLAATHGGRITVTSAGLGGAVGDLEGVPGWLTGVLRQPHCRRKISKLVRSRLDELHLFLGVQDSGAPFAEFHALCWRDGVPVGEPDIGPLTAVWVVARWASAAFVYDVRAGWTRHPLN